MTEAPDDDVVVHPQWQAWVAENLARGAAIDEIVDALVDDGADPDEARTLVAELDRSPAMHEARKLWRRVGALEQIARLRRRHREAQPDGHTTIARRPTPSVEEMLARYWVPGVPVILSDLVTRWPAFERWTPGLLAERLGDETIEACVGRQAAVDPDATWKPLRQVLSVRELMERITAPGRSNDTYVIAKNAALRRPGLRPLLDDIDLPADLFGDHLEPTRMGLWIGPAGTHTPLHHDGDDSMFCQVFGRKRFRLAPPESMPLLDRSRGVYSHWDPADELTPDTPETLLELTLEPGEALFIPSGWWHQVDALDPSISVSVLEWAWPNDFEWYRPGSVLRGSVAP